FPNTDLKVFRAEMSNLEPGKEYCFRVGGEETLYRFRTMPAKATNLIQFVSGGDCGVNDATIATNMMAARQDPYFALIGGDLAYDNGRSPDTFRKFLQNYRAQMIDSEGRLIPMISCLGNHEVNGSYEQPRSASPAYLSVFD